MKVQDQWWIVVLGWAVIWWSSSAGCLAQSEAETEAETEAIGFYASTLWESKYVWCGRNIIEDSGLISFDAGIEYRGFTLGVWYALGDSEDYQELDAYLSYSAELGDFEASLGYMYLQYLEDDYDDNEINVGVTYNGLGYLAVGLEYVHSTEAEGQFLRCEVSSNFPLIEDRITLEPYIIEGVDFGYASEECDGICNLELGLRFSAAVNDWLTLDAYGAYSLAQKDVDREDLGDFAWGGIGISVAF